MKLFDVYPLYNIQEIINSLSPCFSRCIRHLLVLTTCFKSIFLSTMCTMVNAITGSTGAGVKPGATSHFSWRNNNMSVYKAFEYRVESRPGTG